MGEYYKQYLISVLDILQGIPLFQAVAATLVDTVFPFKLQNVYVWLTLFICISEYVLNVLPSETIFFFLWNSDFVLMILHIKNKQVLS